MSICLWIKENNIPCCNVVGKNFAFCFEHHKEAKLMNTDWFVPKKASGKGYFYPPSQKIAWVKYTYEPRVGVIKYEADIDKLGLNITKRSSLVVGNRFRFDNELVKPEGTRFLFEYLDKNSPVYIFG